MVIAEMEFVEVVIVEALWLVFVILCTLKRK